MSQYYKSHIIKIRNQFEIKYHSQRYFEVENHYLLWKVLPRNAGTVQVTQPYLAAIHEVMIGKSNVFILSRVGGRRLAQESLTRAFSQSFESHIYMFKRSRKTIKKLKNYFWLNFEKNVVTWWYYRSNTVETVLSKKETIYLGLSNHKNICYFWA